jgi:hypothetical protein
MAVLLSFPYSTDPEGMMRPNFKTKSTGSTVSEYRGNGIKAAKQLE